VLELPAGVHVVWAKGRRYYYFSPHRGTSYAGKRIALGTEPSDPAFWEALKLARGDRRDIKPGTFAALIAAFRNPINEKWRGYSENTRQNYSISLDRIEAARGSLPVGGLTAIGVYRLRDQFATTPVQANHLVSVCGPCSLGGSREAMASATLHWRLSPSTYWTSKTPGPGPRMRFALCCTRRQSIYAGPPSSAA
jgi:hypothetical protein